MESDYHTTKEAGGQLINNQIYLKFLDVILLSYKLLFIKIITFVNIFPSMNL